jgi:hypothetical protein
MRTVSKNVANGLSAGACRGHVQGITAGHRGAPGRIRTCDLEIRRLLLYPAELRGHVPAAGAGNARIVGEHAVSRCGLGSVGQLSQVGQFQVYCPPRVEFSGTGSAGVRLVTVGSDDRAQLGAVGQCRSEGPDNRLPLTCSASPGADAVVELLDSDLRSAATVLGSGVDDSEPLP